MAKIFGLGDLPALWRDYRFYRRLKTVVPKWDIVPEKTALLVLDMNYVCSHQEHGFGPNLMRVGLEPKFFYRRLDSTVIPNIQKLLATFRQNRMKVIYTNMGAENEDLSDLAITWRKVYPRIGYHQSYPGQKAFEIREEVKPQAGETVLLKRSSGAFATTNLQDILSREGIDTLVITGVETDCCVYNTAIEATDRGLKIFIPHDGCTGLTQSGHNIFLWLYGHLFFCQVRSSNELIREIQEAIARMPQPAKAASA